MEIFWFIIIAIVLAMFFILDGYDFGAGIIHLFFAKKEEDKEVMDVLRTLEPLQSQAPKMAP